MPTKQQTTTSQQTQASQTQAGQSGYQTQFAPAGMAAYNQLIPQYAANLSQFAGNPLQSMFFQNLLGMGQRQIGQQGQAQAGQLAQNLRTMGLSGSSPFAASQLQQLGRSQSGQMSQLFGNLLNQAQQLRFGATGQMGGFSPLATGGSQQYSNTGTQKGTMSGSQTQQLSGLGTWLPQVIGGGLSALSGLGGGLGAFGKSLAGQGGTGPGNISGGLFGMGGAPPSYTGSPWMLGAMQPGPGSWGDIANLSSMPSGGNPLMNFASQ